MSAGAQGPRDLAGAQPTAALGDAPDSHGPTLDMPQRAQACADGLDAFEAISSMGPRFRALPLSVRETLLVHVSLARDPESWARLLRSAVAEAILGLPSHQAFSLRKPLAVFLEAYADLRPLARQSVERGSPAPVALGLLREDLAAASAWRLPFAHACGAAAAVAAEALARQGEPEWEEAARRKALSAMGSPDTAMAQLALRALASRCDGQRLEAICEAARISQAAGPAARKAGPRI